SNFDALIKSCSECYDCMAIDFPGHGQEARDVDFSIEAFTGFLIRHIEQQEDAPVSVFGYSMGGYIALNAMTQKPDLFAKVMTLGTKFNWTTDEGSKQAAMLNAEKILEKVPQYAAYLSQLHVAHNWKEVMSDTASLIAQLAADPPLDISLLAALDQPVCVGLGDRDTMVTLEETVNVYKQCKRGSLYVVPQMQHPIEKIRCALMMAHIQSFFSGD
ncbi:MAG: alpha/beta hydrolase, partial [Chitinophagaceae bacterium]|nr:alpha/beta hydrolase [Chitinophagaceae bacterium]